MKVAVKYCGGCNPTFDRVAFCDRVFEAFPTLTKVSGEECAQPVLVICGCSRNCAGHYHVEGIKGKFVVCAANDFDELCRDIAQMLLFK